MHLLKNIPFHAIALLLSVLLLLLGNWKHQGAQSQFAADLMVAYQNLNGPNDQVKLSRITRFGWDRMFVFPPYTPTSEISKILGASVPDVIEKIGIERREDINLLVFLDGSKIVEVSPVSRSAVDIFVGLVGISLDTSNAVFAKSSNGKLLALAQYRN
jgi:hypothetical protein